MNSKNYWRPLKKDALLAKDCSTDAYDDCDKENIPPVKSKKAVKSTKSGHAPFADITHLYNREVKYESIISKHN